MRPLVDPKAGGPLEPHKVAGVRVLSCPFTGGVWCDKGQLAEICQTPEDLRAIFPARSVTDCACPRGCSGRLVERQYSKMDGTLLLDQCPACQGIYLDAGELSAVLALNARIRKMFGDGTFTGPPRRGFAHLTW